MAEDNRDEERERERQRKREVEAGKERVEGDDEDGPPASEETQEMPTEEQAEEWEEGEEERPVGQAEARMEAGDDEE